MATIRDVAKSAGVSVATVSRVLNGDNVVTSATKEKVREAVRKLDYRPNLLGKGLRQSQTRKILVLLPTISNTFYTRIVRSMEQEAQKNGYSIVIGVTHSSRDKELEYLQMLGRFCFLPNRTRKNWAGLQIDTRLCSAANMSPMRAAIP